MQTVANLQDVFAPVITITIQYRHIEVIMCWCTLCVCVRVCVHACVIACVKHCAKKGEIDLTRIIFY